MAERSPPANGFTLIEVLVALVASGLLLAVVMNGAVGARERQAFARDRGEAVLIARDLMTRAAAAPFAQGVRRGDEGRLRWTLTERAAAADPRGRFVLAGLAIEVSDRGGRRLLRAETRQLKVAPGR